MQEGMRFSRNGLIRLLVLTTTMLLISIGAWAQSRTSGAIAGVVQDPSGAVVPNATVIATEVTTGAVRTTKGTGSGNYVFGDLNPGLYKVKVEASGFESSELGPLQVPVSVTVTLNVTMRVGEATQTVTVTEAAPVIEVQNPNTTTTLTATQIANLPNPGQDLSYEANVAPGAVMNSGGGYGNTEFNGLPAVSNNFSQDGIPANDPFLNLNNSGATNLQLGLNSEQEVAVNTNSFDTSQGGLGAMQMEYISQKGGNQFHGDLYEIWNGANLNSADYFVNATPGSTKPGSNVNEYGGRIGEPIKRDKAFFFTDIEGIRIALPVISTVTVPSAAYQNYILTQALPTGGGVDPTLGVTLSAQPQEIPFYKQMFGVYGTPSGTPIAEQFCPLGADGCALRRVASTGANTRDFLWTSRVDQNLNDSNQIWYRYQYENGFQATYNDPFNSALSAVSKQPQDSASLGYTHTFGTSMVNEFDPGFQWYSALFGPASLSKAVAVFPEVLDGTFGNILPFNLGGFTATGGSNYIWPQGRNVTQYFVDDNFSWTKGKNQFKFGEQFHRFLVSDHDFGIENTPLVIQLNLPEYTYGAAALAFENYAKSLDEPIAAAGIDMYAQDAIKVKPDLTLTLGIRSTWNSNFTNQQGLFAQFSGPAFSQTNHSLTSPVKDALAQGLSQGFGATPLLMWQPRGAIAWQFRPDTVFRAGFGVFTDLFPGTVSDTLAENAPYYNSFAGGLIGSVGGTAIAPGVPGSAISATGVANQSLLANLANGGLSCAAGQTTTCVPAVTGTAFPHYVKYPYSMQWNFGIQHQFGPSWGLDVTYVGTRSVQEPFYQQADAYETTCAGCWKPFPSTAPDARFGGISQLLTGADSNYNGLQITGRKIMSHGLQFSANYTWSHCLDSLSNGGFFGFATVSAIYPLPNELSRDYGNCDYDVRNGFNGSYVWQLPSPVHGGFLRHALNGWQVSGDIYLRSGFPLTVFGANPGSILNTGGFAGSNFGPIFASTVGQNSTGNYAHSPISGITQVGEVQYLNPNAFESPFDTATGACVGGNSPATCQFGDVGRNSVFSPGFFWTNMFVSKYFKLSENWKLRIDAQFYNLFNHPNFGFPANTAGVPGVNGTEFTNGTAFGTITNLVSPPTGLLGSGLGGDSAVRMIALQARIEF